MGLQEQRGLPGPALEGLKPSLTAKVILGEKTYSAVGTGKPELGMYRRKKIKTSLLKEVEEKQPAETSW